MALVPAGPGTPLQQLLRQVLARRAQLAALQAQHAPHPIGGTPGAGHVPIPGPPVDQSPGNLHLPQQGNSGQPPVGLPVGGALGGGNVGIQPVGGEPLSGQPILPYHPGNVQPAIHAIGGTPGSPGYGVPSQVAAARRAMLGYA